MTKQEMIELARQALKQEPREDWNSTAWVFADETLQAFAKLVAEHEREACTAHAMTSAEKAIDVAIKLEREACAKVCDGYSNGRHANMADLCAEAIRARGEQE